MGEAGAAEIKMKEAEIAMKMARKLVAERKKKNKGGKQRQQKQLQRRSQTTKLLQCNSTSISSLKTLAIKETRHEENRRAIPEGNEDEDKNDDSIVKSISTASTTDLNESGSDSNSNRNCNYKIEKGDIQIEERGQQRFALAKSVVIAKSA